MCHETHTSEVPNGPGQRPFQKDITERLSLILLSNASSLLSHTSNTGLVPGAAFPTPSNLEMVFFWPIPLWLSMLFLSSSLTYLQMTHSNPFMSTTSDPLTVATESRFEVSKDRAVLGSGCGHHVQPVAAKQDCSPGDHRGENLNLPDYSPNASSLR